MISTALSREVAQATGESVRTIRRLGFSIVRWPSAKTVRCLRRARRRLSKTLVEGDSIAQR